ncbi:MAG: hypothetical protein JW739_04350 [Opitutales bacterium]|nr:hypothetical protein [Opitutales bacterium]
MNTLPQISTAFDIGYNSIGWAVLSHDKDGVAQELSGCGTLIFPKEDNQSKQRALFRRQRRNIAARRNRISRIRRFIVESGLMNQSQMDSLNRMGGGHAAPWILAAQALNGVILNASELTHVLIWYAHNRGYDGNAKWSRSEEDGEDTEKVNKARGLMEQKGTQTMAETWVKLADVELHHKGRKSSTYYLKGESVAFPRKTVEAEVERILESHIGKIPGVDTGFITALMRTLTEEQRSHFKLPKRYDGGLLFGQMIPRFDNRIIPTCPISGEKTPLKFCPEFFAFRWGMLLANMRVLDAAEKSRPLTVDERHRLHARVSKKGFTTKGELKKLVAEITGANTKPLDDLFFTAESEDALVLDPTQKALDLKGVAEVIPENTLKALQKTAWIKKGFSLKEVSDIAQATGAHMETLNKAVQEQFEKQQKKKRRKDAEISFEQYVGEWVDLKKYASGRAPYARPLLQQAFDQALKGLHPSAQAAQQAPWLNGQTEDGCLVRTVSIIEKELEKSIDEMTNNHLVRHRIKLFERLYEDIIREYAGGDCSRICNTTIEVADDIKEFSGMTAKEKAAHFSAKTKPFRDAEKYIKDILEEEGGTFDQTYANIRKVRLAIAQNWECAYTGKKFDLSDIQHQRVEREHIIPRSKRTSDSLDSLVLVFAEVNRKKSDLTAYEFIEQYEGQAIGSYRIRSLDNYIKWVLSLPPRGGKQSLSDEDKIGKRRKQKLLLQHYDEKEEDFLPRMLTATSHLNKVAALKAKNLLKLDEENYDGLMLPQNRTGHIPGSITSRFRAAWNVLHLLGEVCPEIITPAGELRKKGDIRDITHMHHAIDAITLALIRHKLPNGDRALYEAILKRSPSPQDKEKVLKTDLFLQNLDGTLFIRDLPDSLKESIVEALKEKRVVQHVPATMDGLKAEQTTWGIKEIDETTGKATITQRKALTTPKGPQRRELKEAQESVSKLLGVREGTGGKLQAVKGAVVISDNYGVALSNPPKVIRYCNVYKQLEALEFPQVLRIGNIIEVPEGRYKGRWMIRSVKENKSAVAVDMATPEMVQVVNKSSNSKINVNLNTLISSKMRILKGSLVG